MSSRNNSASAWGRRQTLRHRWSVFVRENFRNPAHVASVFEVDTDCARRWWDGLNAPSGFAVEHAYETMPPEAMRALRPLKAA